jgi:two-component system OmpR family sensor kinase
MGVFSGFVAALAVLPVALLLAARDLDRAVADAIEAAVLSAEIVAKWPGSGSPPSLRGAGETAVMVVWQDGQPRMTGELEGFGPDQAKDIAERLCKATPQHDAVSWGGRRLVWACANGLDRTALVAVEPGGVSLLLVGFLLFAFVVIVGLVTALTVLRVLSPLGRLSTALTRVGAGERNVRLSPTGLAELDELVYRVNDTAVAMEAREDAITTRLRLVQRMGRIVAHEVRNPLQSLELLTSLLEAEEDPHARRETGLAIRQEIRALDQVVSRMLQQSLGSDLDLRARPGTLRPLVDQVVALHRPGAKQKGIELTHDPIPDVTLRIDGALMGRSFENLVVNALQHARSAVSLAGRVVDDHIEIWIDDDGPGVPTAIADRIFEPNVTERPGGSGLGLALVKAVVDAHEGTVVHQTSPLGGARFLVRLPLRGASESAKLRVGQGGGSTS